jgi:uncharacterized membrane protein HdeD (DUF308 family)
MTNTHAEPRPGSILVSAFLGALAENWWLLLVRGLAAIAFGVLTFVWPGLTLLTLTFLFGAYALVDGCISLWVAMTGPGEKASRWWLALVGIAGILSGIVAFLMPEIIADVLLLLIAGWAIAIGVMEVWGAIRLRKEIEGEWMLGLSGLLAVAFGVALVAWPIAGALTMILLIGWFAVLVGCVYAGLAFQLRKHKRPA